MGKAELSNYLARIGSKGGKKTASGMTKKQRVERARNAAFAKALNELEKRDMENAKVVDTWARAEEWLTASEAAAYLKVESRSLLRWVREGRIPAYKLSGTKRHVYRFRARDLNAALMARPVDTAVQAVTQ